MMKAIEISHNQELNIIEVERPVTPGREEVLLKQGNSTLIPAAIADYDIIPQSGKTRILDAFIDNMDRSITSKVTRFLHLTQK